MDGRPHLSPRLLPFVSVTHYNITTLGLLLINRPRRDGRLSWPCWLTDSRRRNHEVVTFPASSLAQGMGSSLAETSVPCCFFPHPRTKCWRRHWLTDRLDGVAAAPSLADGEAVSATAAH